MIGPLLLFVCLLRHDHTVLYYFSVRCMLKASIIKTLIRVIHKLLFQRASTVLLIIPYHDRVYMIYLLWWNYSL